MDLNLKTQDLARLLEWATADASENDAFAQAARAKATKFRRAVLHCERMAQEWTEQASRKRALADDLKSIISERLEVLRRETGDGSLTLDDLLGQLSPVVQEEELSIGSEASLRPTEPPPPQAPAAGAKGQLESGVDFALGLLETLASG